MLKHVKSLVSLNHCNYKLKNPEESSSSEFSRHSSVNHRYTNPRLSGLTLGCRQKQDSGRKSSSSSVSSSDSLNFSSDGSFIGSFGSNTDSIGSPTSSLCAAALCLGSFGIPEVGTVSENDDMVYPCQAEIQSTLRRLAMDTLPTASLTKLRMITQCVTPVINIGRTFRRRSSSQDYDSDQDVLEELTNLKLLVLCCPQDEVMGHCFTEYLIQAFPSVDVSMTFGPCGGQNELDYWEEVMDSTHFILVLMSDAFSQFMRNDYAFDVVRCELRFRTSMRIRLVPIYLEEVADYDSSEFGHRLAVRLFNNAAEELHRLHRDLKLSFENEIKKRYSHFLKFVQAQFY